MEEGREGKKGKKERKEGGREGERGEKEGGGEDWKRDEELHVQPFVDQKEHQGNLLHETHTTCHSLLSGWTERTQWLQDQVRGCGQTRGVAITFL